MLLLAAGPGADPLAGVSAESLKALIGGHGLEMVDPPRGPPTHVVLLDTGDFTCNYVHRGPRLAHLSPMQYFAQVQVAPRVPTEPPLTTARTVLDLFAFTEMSRTLRAPGAHAALEERQRKRAVEAERVGGEGWDPLRQQLRLQLAACATCGASGPDIALLTCSGCESFAYCGVECQREDFKRRHKHMCLKKHAKKGQVGGGKRASRK